MKTTVVEDREIINFLSERVARLEQSAETSEASGSDVAMLTRPKQWSLKTSTKNNDEENYVRQPFYGPATSCDELGKIGYTLNGYYLVNGKKESQIPAIEIIYCYYKNTGEPNGSKNTFSNTLFNTCQGFTIDFLFTIFLNFLLSN